jgi:YidC/Oxa1 family membrane protein insertase
MSVFFDLIAALLAYIYALWNNYAWAISGLTLVIMIVLTPLTLKGTRSMMVMQQLQPEMKKIQTRYKDDRQKLNEELLKFYKENDINPLGGCLPLLVQMPVFIVLYAVLRGLTRRTSPTGFNFGFTGGQLGKAVSLVPPPTPAIPASGAHCATPAATPGACFDPSYLKHQTDLYQSLSHSTTMNALGMNLAESASKAVSSGAYHAAPYIILIAIVGVTGWVQQKQIQGRTPNAQVPQQQQAVMKIMPFFLPIISIGLPAGLVLYFAVSNTYRVAQQWFIGRSIYGPAEAEQKVGAVKGDSSASSGTAASSAAKPGGAKPKQGRIAAAMSAAAAKADQAKAEPAKADDDAATTNGSSRATKNAGRPSTKPAKAPAKTTAKTTGKSSGSTTDKSPSRGNKAPPKSASKSTSNGSNGSAKSSDEAAPAKPVLQPRARKKKE